MADLHPIRIAIAEQLGWAQKWSEEYQCDVWHNPQGVQWPEPPDYTGSLDAIAEAEKTLTDNQHRQFRAHLREITSIGLTDYHAKHRAYISASAEQRARAFWMTRNRG